MVYDCLREAGTLKKKRLMRPINLSSLRTLHDVLSDVCIFPITPTFVSRITHFSELCQGLCIIRGFRQVTKYINSE